MIGKREFAGGVSQSGGAGLVLLWLLHRAMERTGAHPDLFFLRVIPDFVGLEWTWPYLIAVAVGFVVAVSRRSHTAVVRLQWYALGGGVFLMLYGSGFAGDKFDPRLLYAILGGVASLYSCYACLLAHVAVAMLSLRSTTGPRTGDAP